MDPKKKEARNPDHFPIFNMPVMSLHPLPANPTTGQQPSANFGARSVSAASSMSVPLASAAGGGGVSREVLKGLQDVAWSDDEVSVLCD